MKIVYELLMTSSTIPPNWAYGGDEVVRHVRLRAGPAGETVHVEPPVLNRNVKQGEPMFSIESRSGWGINATVSGGWSP